MSEVLVRLKEGYSERRCLTLTTERTLKKDKLRYIEYYNLQETFDALYAQSKQGKAFENLYDIITREENVLLAYRSIKRNKGSHTAGVNRRTVIDWETIHPEQYVDYVRKRLRNFFPHKVMRKEIPKPNGKMRPLGIPTMEDRFIQQCIKQVLEPIVEAKFHPSSYGFRPNRSTHHAISEFMRKVNISHLYYVVEVDIRSFFDNVDHGKLLKQLWQMGIQDKRLLSILSKMLKAEVEHFGKPDKGTPQGGILSPVLANVVLNELDWWIDSQWQSFNAKEVKPRNRTSGIDRGNFYAKLRNTTDLKEIYILRYADDFKIFCRYKDVAAKIFAATKQWLKERLNLDISEEKSKITDIRKGSAEFLGFRLKAKKKRGKWVVFSHMIEEALQRSANSIREAIDKIKKHPTPQTVGRYNALVRGLQNYYGIATHVNPDFSRLDFLVMKHRYNHLRPVMSDEGKLSRTYREIYKGYNYQQQFVAGVCLFPIPAVKHKNPMGFSPKVCDYTVEGRTNIHSNLSVNMEVVQYLTSNPMIDDSLELADNRISLYSAQKGRCGITGEELGIGDMHCHHKVMKSKGGTDAYKNLVWVTNDVHILIHATRDDTIERYLSLTKLNKGELSKLNKLRELVGNCVIDKVV